MKIGVFDSGRGGRFVAAKLQQLLPDHEYIVIDDRAHAPYGERLYEEIEQLTHQAIEPLLNCDYIVIACNTATAAAIKSLRSKYPDKSFIGFEPMVKPAAAASETRHITLLATQATAYSSRTQELIDQYARGVTIDRPSTINWAYLIDQEQPDAIDCAEVAQSIEAGSDAIIIGCTHYMALVSRLQQMFPDTTIYEPTGAVARYLESLINSALQR